MAVARFGSGDLSFVSGDVRLLEWIPAWQVDSSHMDPCMAGTCNSGEFAVWAGAARSQWIGSEEANVGEECRDEARGWW